MPQIDDLVQRRQQAPASLVPDPEPDFIETPRSRAGVYRRYLKRLIVEGLWPCSVPLAEEALLTLLAQSYTDALKSDLISLPPERGGRHLDTMSRTPLREALSSLEQRRLIGRGKAGRAVPRALTPRDRAEIFEARRLIEPHGAQRAAQIYRASPRFQNRLKAIWLGLENSVKEPEDIGRYIELDIAFHSEIARASSEVLGMVVEMTMEQTVVGGRRTSEFANYLRKVAPKSKRKGGIHLEHKRIFQAISRGLEREAFEAMTDHVTQAQARIEEVAQSFTF